MVGGECNTADSHYILKNSHGLTWTVIKKKSQLSKKSKREWEKKPFTGIEIGARD